MTRLRDRYPFTETLLNTLELARMAGNTTACGTCGEPLSDIDLKWLGRDFGAYLYGNIDAEFWRGLCDFIKEKE